MTSTVLDISSLKARFESSGHITEALGGVSATLKSGTALALVGESGSGKTTLLRCALGLERPASGSVSLFETGLAGASAAKMIGLRRRCGYVPQDPFGCLPPTLTASQAVAEPIRLARPGLDKAAARQRALELLAECGLTDPGIADARVRYSLSGGQKQRVSIARALSLDPELLLADEPTSMQDAATRGEIIDFLRKRVSAGMALIFATHDLQLALAAAEQAIVLYGGLVMETAPSGDLFKRPRHPYTRALMEALPMPGKPPRAATARNGTEISFDQPGCPFAPRCPIRSDACRDVPPLADTGKGRKTACWNV
ncbi:MAG: ABC transporter ATP-binding protein [Synergistota bacterium]|nr:ABC transporter ATP-binding protein [Synergistota bacterium]